MRTAAARWFFGPVLLLLVGTVTLAGCSSTTTEVYVLRHAEKGAGANPDLTPAGAARAQELSRVLSEVPVAAVYSTNTNRTMQTAQPVATAQGVAVTNYSDLTALRDSVLGGFRDDIVVVVGHSNTVPDIISAFGGTPTTATLADNEFDNLFLLVITEVKQSDGSRRKRVDVLHMKYGAVSN